MQYNLVKANTLRKIDIFMNWTVLDHVWAWKMIRVTNSQTGGNALAKNFKFKANYPKKTANDDKN